uniref:Uncharacterized protein n=1 Tax=viral metagenome TaxID=1070528 RepID=A0A6H1ZNR0_9ZZZZ
MSTIKNHMDFALNFLVSKVKEEKEKELKSWCKDTPRFQNFTYYVGKSGRSGAVAYTRTSYRNKTYKIYLGVEPWNCYKEKILKKISLCEELKQRDLE